MATKQRKRRTAEQRIADLEREEPILDSKRHPWACAYREYLTDDARLVLANLRAATRAGAPLAPEAPQLTSHSSVASQGMSGWFQTVNASRSTHGSYGSLRSNSRPNCVTTVITPSLSTRIPP